MSLKPEEIKGWMRPAELAWIREQAPLCSLVIQIGPFRGRSSRAWVDHMKPGGQLIDIDPWLPNRVNRYSGDEDFEVYKQNMADAHTDGRCMFFRLPSDDGIEQVKGLAGEVDLVFVDGNHTAPFVRRDIKNYLPLVKIGGVFSGHDFGNPGVRAALKKMGLLPFLHTTNSGSPQMIWWTVVTQEIRDIVAVNAHLAE